MRPARPKVFFAALCAGLVGLVPGGHTQQPPSFIFVVVVDVLGAMGGDFKVVARERGLCYCPSLAC